MPNTIRIKRGVGEPLPGNLVQGELAIDTGDGSLYCKTDDGLVTRVLAKSQSVNLTVRNETGSTIPAMSAVYITGAASNKALVGLARANSESTSSKTLGLTAKAIPHNQNGEVVIFGTLTKVDTTAFTAGQKLWLSATTAGAITATMPTAPNHAVFIGDVVRVHANQGQIEVRVQNGFELAELHDLSLSSLQNNQVLAYESSTGLWKNKDAASAGLAPLASPAFTGNPTAPNGNVDTSAGTQLATQSYAYEMSTLGIVNYYESGWNWGSAGNLTRSKFLIYDNSADATVNLPTDGTYNYNVGHRLVFGQASAGKLNFGASFGISLTSLDNKTSTAGPGAVVTAVKTAANSWWIFGDLIVGYPAAGSVLSVSCVATTGTDYNNNEWSGAWDEQTTYADGSGGTYTGITGTNTRGCYLPSGWVYESSYSDATLSWYHGSDSGNFVYGTSYSVSQADGAGGQNNSSGTNISATEGQLVHSYIGYDYDNSWNTNERLRFRSQPNGPELYTESFPVSGVVIASGCTTVYEQDAGGNYWTVPKAYADTADGNGGSTRNYYMDNACGYYPSGYYVSYSSQCFQSLTYTDEYGGNQSFCYNSGYYYDAADGMGGTYSGSQSTYQAQSGDVFYSYYDGNNSVTVNYAYDGMGGYYTFTS